jgi:serine/threonine-protein kinase RsbW
MTHTLQKSLDKSLSALIELAAEVQVFLTGCGVPERALFNVQLAIEETIRNLIEHSTGTAIELRIDVEHGRVTILLEDDGQAFDPATALPFDPSKPLEERTPHGMGLHLLRHFVDEIHYERLDSRNRLRLVVGSSPQPKTCSHHDSIR